MEVTGLGPGGPDSVGAVALDGRFGRARKARVARCRFDLAASCGRVDHYHLWFGLRAGVKDLDFVAAAQAMLGHMREAGSLESFTIQRRKLGFGPSEIGEWHIDIVTRDMAQLEAAFAQVAPRSGKMEKLHADVWSKVEGLRTGLYRDFPDAVRVQA